MNKKYFHYDESIDKKYIEDAFKKDFDIWDSQLNLEEKESILEYSYKRNKDINLLLRNIEHYKNINENSLIDILTKHIPNIDSAILKGKLSNDIILYRGANIENLSNIHDLFDKMSIEDFKEYIDFGYISTSISRKKAEEFIKNDEKCKFIFKIYTEKGMECAFISAGNKHALFNEHEVLLPRRTKFEITNMTKHKDTITIECKEVRQNEG